MTTKQATGIALKFFAIYFLFNLLMVIPSYVTLGSSIKVMTGDQPSMLVVFLIPLIGIVVCIIAIGLLWKVSNSLISKTRTDEEPIVNNMTTDGIMETVLACMGLYFAIQGIISFSQTYAVSIGFPQLNFKWLVAPTVQFVVGCFLIAKPKQWVKVIRSIGEK